MSRVATYLLVLSAVLVVRPLGAGEGDKPRVKADHVARAFDVLRQAAGMVEPAPISTPLNQLHLTFSDEALLALLKVHNESAEQVEENLFRYELSDAVTVIVRNYNASGLQARYIKASQTKDSADFSFDAMNEWNRTKRPMKAYLSQDDTATLEFDILSAGGGITNGVVTSALAFFDGVIPSFNAHLKAGAK